MQAAEELNIKTECIFSSEIEKNAITIYNKNFGEIPSGDITAVRTDDIDTVDVLCGGFPCQAFSIAGNRNGFDDARGTLFFEIARIARDKRPKILFLENVKGLLNHDKGRTFAVILLTLDELGYDVEWQVLNSKDFGVPQNRERVFIIGHLRGAGTRQIFPVFGETSATSRENSSTCLDANYWEGIDNHGARTHVIISDSGKSRELQVRTDVPPLRVGGGGCGQHNFVASAVLTPDRAEKRQNGRRFKNPDEPMFTLTAQDKHGVLIEPCLKFVGAINAENKWLDNGKNLSRNYPQGNRVYSADGIAQCLSSQLGGMSGGSGLYQVESRIRKLTPIECERLQGYPDNWTEGIADTNRYKCLGNAVTVPVIKAIAKKILLTLHHP